MRYADPLAQAEIDRLTAKLEIEQSARREYANAVREAHRRVIGRACVCAFCTEDLYRVLPAEEGQ